MSDKFQQVLKKARETYLIEKNRFLDALADFIKDRPYLVSDGDHFHLFIRSRTVGGNEAFIPIYGFTFYAGMKEATETNSSTRGWNYCDVKVELSQTVIFKMLEEEYNAKISQLKDTFVYDVAIPFV